MDEQPPVTLVAPKSLIEMLTELPDRRDNRGKEHELAFVLACVIVALLNNRLTLSSIHRFILHRFDWLSDIFERPNSRPVSRAQLPLILRSVDYPELNARLKEFFETEDEIIPDQWFAIDGKRLRGTIGTRRSAVDAEQILSVVGHETQELVYQQAFAITHSHESREVRAALQIDELQQANVTMDALHNSPETLESIQAASGGFIVQVKKTRNRSSSSASG